MSPSNKTTIIVVAITPLKWYKTKYVDLHVAAQQRVEAKKTIESVSIRTRSRML